MNCIRSHRNTDRCLHHPTEAEPGCVVMDHCVAGSPCQHGGTCTPSAGGYNCSCPGAWSGPHCAEQADPCRAGSTTALCGAAHWSCTRDTDNPAGYNCSCESRPGWAALSGQSDTEQARSLALMHLDGSWQCWDRCSSFILKLHCSGNRKLPSNVT